ncbi:MAG: gluconate 2-dehydrogenase subunit 3 family protein [Bryobacteraceae bacterium]|nr:gluconate 2-dehydrogenase subunit 3 family protein [Bryobacteraceae bacterium]
MIRSDTPDRRRFLAAAAAAGALAGCSSSSWRSLAPAEAAALAAVVDTLIPPDGDPGAAQAGVVQFIDRQLAKRYRKHRSLYSQALALLERRAKEQHARPFAELPLADRTALLAAWERSQGLEKDFFELALAHTMQGYYGSPRHGGNRNAASWRMLGVPHPPVRGRLHYGA